MGRVLGIDYGEKRIGLAISDEEQKFAFEFEIWQALEFFGKIQDLIAEKEIGKVILGYPLNMSGEQTAKTQEVLDFKNRLEDAVPGIEVELLDERLSSKMAETILRENNLNNKNKNVDSLAAQIFLQNYLNKQNGKIQKEVQ